MTGDGGTGPPPGSVLITTTTFPRWEGDTMPPFIMHLTQGLAAAGWRVVLLAPHHRGARYSENRDGVRIYRFPYAPAWLERLAYGDGILPNIKRTPAAALLLVPFLVCQILWSLFLVRRHRLDLVNAHWIVPQGLSALLARLCGARAPLVCTVHGGDIFALRRLAPLRPLLRAVLGRADRVTVNSGYTRDAVAALAPGARVEVIPMGVDGGRFAPGDDARPEECGDGPCILYCGRLALKKGVAYLIEAMTAVRAGHPAARLLVIGDGEERGRLEALVRARRLEETVRFLGPLPNEALPRYYRGADLFVCPSIVDERGDTEGLGVVLLEAAASGLPSVASRIGGIPDVVTDGETGLLVPERDAAALAGAVVRLLDDPGLRERLGRAARARVEEGFTWPRVVRRFGALFAAVRREAR